MPLHAWLSNFHSRDSAAHLYLFRRIGPPSRSVTAIPIAAFGSVIHDSAPALPALWRYHTLSLFRQ